MILAGAEWRACLGREGYQASNLGGIRNATTGRVLSPWKHKSGHLYVSLGRGCKRQVHRLVIEAFRGLQPDGMECRHLDGVPANNQIENLEWGTRAQNIDDLKAASGRYAKASISDDLALRIKRAFTGKHGDQSRIAREFGLSLSMVNRIVRGRTYAHIGD